MAGFFGRWLSDALRLGLPLVLALATMQVPALAHGYAAALLQIAEDARRDIEQRKAAARRFYRDAGDADEAVIAALQAVEPSNAEALAASVGRARALRAAHDRIQASPPLLRYGASGLPFHPTLSVVSRLPPPSTSSPGWASRP